MKGFSPADRLRTKLWFQCTESALPGFRQELIKKRFYQQQQVDGWKRGEHAISPYIFKNIKRDFKKDVSDLYKFEPELFLAFRGKYRSNSNSTYPSQELLRLINSCCKVAIKLKTHKPGGFHENAQYVSAQSILSATLIEANEGIAEIFLSENPPSNLKYEELIRCLHKQCAYLGLPGTNESNLDSKSNELLTLTDDYPTPMSLQNAELFISNFFGIGEEEWGTLSHKIRKSVRTAWLDREHRDSLEDKIEALDAKYEINHNT